MLLYNNFIGKFNKRKENTSIKTTTRIDIWNKNLLARSSFTISGISINTMGDTI